MTFLIIFLSVLFTFVIALAVPFSQYKSVYINPDNFKRKKVKRFSFMFRGIGGKDCIYGNVKTYGVAYPLYIFHIIGYILSLISLALTFVLLFAFNVSINIITYVNLSICLGFLIIYIIGITILEFISKKRDKEKDLYGR